MPRIEKQASLEKQIEDVKKNIVQEMEPQKKSRKPWFTCFAYTQPAPLREVTPGVPVETVLREQMTTSFLQRFREGGRLLPSPNQMLEVSVSEASLTATLRSKLEESPLEGLDISALQVVLEPDLGVEVFIPVEESDLQTAVILFFDVIVKDGAIAVIPKDVFVGSAHLPSFLVNMFLTSLLEQRLAQLNKIVVGYTKISSIDIFSGELLIKGTLSVEWQRPL